MSQVLEPSSNPTTSQIHNIPVTEHESDLLPDGTQYRDGSSSAFPQDPMYRWTYALPRDTQKDITVLDDDNIDAAALERVQVLVTHVTTTARRKLEGKDATPTNLLKLMWTRTVFNLLVDNFQLRDCNLPNEPTYLMWASFMGVILKSSFYNCASFAELYDCTAEYGETSNLLPEKTFMAMKRGLSASATPGDDQRVLNESYDFDAGDDRTGDYSEWEELLTKLAAPFLPSRSFFMIDDDHFETQADAGAVATQKNPKKGRSGPLGDVACVADIRLISAVSLRRREDNALQESVRRVTGRLGKHGKKPAVIFCDRGYSTYSVIAALREDDISVFGTSRDFHSRTNPNGPFEFLDRKDGPTKLLRVNYDKRTSPSYSRLYVQISGRGCAMEVSAEAGNEGLVAVARRNGGQAGTGITIVYSKNVEGDPRLVGCERGVVVVQTEAGKTARRDANASARMQYSSLVSTRVLKPLQSDALRQLTGEQATDDWFLLRFGRVTSTGAVRVLSLRGPDMAMRTEATAADGELQSAVLRQSGVGQGGSIFERLLSVWLMRPLGGGRAAGALRLGRLNEPKTQAHLPQFCHTAAACDKDVQHHYFAGNYDIGLVSRTHKLPTHVHLTLDRELDILAASVDGLCTFVDVGQLKNVDMCAYEMWVDAFSEPVTSDTHMSTKARRARAAVLEVANSEPAVLLDVVVEIKTATTDRTIERARWDLKDCNRELGSAGRVFLSCSDGDDVYKKLVPAAYRVQLRHHAAVYEITRALFVRSCPDGIIYAVIVKYSLDDLSMYRAMILSIVLSDAIFLYQKKGFSVLPSVSDDCYKHAQDRNGFVYTVSLWRSFDLHIRKVGFYKNGASICPGPHALWPKVKPFVDVMSRYMTHIEAGRRSNLNISQFIALRFLNYLLYNSYVIHRVLAVADIFKNSSEDSASAVLTAVSKSWRALPLRKFVSQINEVLRTNGPSILLPDVLSTNVSAPAPSSSAEERNVSHSSVTATPRQPWPRRYRRKFADVEPWLSQRLSKDWPHELCREKNTRPCVACTVYEGTRPVKKAKTSTFSCSGCDNIVLCVRPPTDGRSKSCWARWHSNARINT